MLRKIVFFLFSMIFMSISFYFLLFIFFFVLVSKLMRGWWSKEMFNYIKFILVENSSPVYVKRRKFHEQKKEERKLKFLGRSDRWNQF